MDDDEQPVYPATNLADAFRVDQLCVEIVPESLASQLAVAEFWPGVDGPPISITAFGSVEVPAMALGIPLPVRTTVKAAGTWLVTLSQLACIVAATERVTELLSDELRAAYAGHLAEARELLAGRDLTARDMAAEAASLTPQMFTEGERRPEQRVTPDPHWISDMDRERFDRGGFNPHTEGEHA